MSNFVKSFTETFEFDGDSVRATMRSIKRKDALLLFPFLEERDNEENFDPRKQLEFLDTAAGLVPEYLVDFRGLYIEGEEVRLGSALFQTVVSDLYFAPLLMMIFSTIMRRSSVEQETEGKSVEPLDAISVTSAPTQMSVSED